MAIDGTWNIVMKTPIGDQTATLVVTSDNGGLSGTMSGTVGATTLKDGTVSGNEVAWKTDITSPMPMTLEFNGAVEGDSVSGKLKLGMFGTTSFAGTRVPG